MPPPTAAPTQIKLPISPWAVAVMVRGAAEFRIQAALAPSTAVCPCIIRHSLFRQRESVCPRQSMQFGSSWLAAVTSFRFSTGSGSSAVPFPPSAFKGLARQLLLRPQALHSCPLLLLLLLFLLVSLSGRNHAKYSRVMKQLANEGLELLPPRLLIPFCPRKGCSAVGVLLQIC